MRELAKVVRIDEILPIEGADAIEQCVVGGWLVVAKKGEYQPGDLAVYIEPDAWVPTELAPFLTKPDHFPKEYNGVKGERLKTIRLRGAISQGLLLKLESVFPTVTPVAAEGTNVTELLGIQKWEAPIPAELAGQVAGNWPAGVQKTDQERIQNLRKEWEREWKDFEWEVTEKLEGSSMTVGIIRGEFVVCSRNVNLRETEGNTFWQMARKYDIENKMRAAELDNIVLQGELIGPGVEGNIYQLKEHKFYVYDVLDTVTGKYLAPSVRRCVVEQLGLLHVPVMVERECYPRFSVQDMLSCATGYSHLNIKVLREGLVFKRVNGPEHFKAVSNEYLAKKKG